jgi:hypothetical protein
LIPLKAPVPAGGETPSPPATYLRESPVLFGARIAARIGNMVDRGRTRNILPQPARAGLLLTFVPCLIELAHRAAAGGGAEFGAACGAALVLAAALATGGGRPCLAPATARRMR